MVRSDRFLCSWNRLDKAQCYIRYCRHVSGCIQVVKIGWATDARLGWYAPHAKGKIRVGEPARLCALGCTSALFSYPFLGCRSPERVPVVLLLEAFPLQALPHRDQYVNRLSRQYRWSGRSSSQY